MNVMWSFGKALLHNWKQNRSDPCAGATGTHHELRKEEEVEELGVTEQLVDFVKSFTVDTFKNYSLALPDDDDGDDDASPSSRINVRKDLNEWQERHATLILSKVKEISQLRYVLCPRHLKERQFWKIYFNLVKSYVTPYQIRAIQKAKLRRMGKEDEKFLDSTCEVEMAEANGTTSVSAPASLKHEL